MSSTSKARTPKAPASAARARSRLKSIACVPLLALACGVQAAADTITMQDVVKDAQGKKAVDKVRERVLERIGEGVASGVECVEPSFEWPVKKEVLAGAGAVGTGIIVITTVFTSDPDPLGPSDPEPDPAQPVPEPAALVLLATGLGYARFRLRKRAGRRGAT